MDPATGASGSVGPGPQGSSGTASGVGPSTGGVLQGANMLLHSYALKLPPPSRTGNKSVDAANMDTHKLLQNVVSAMLQDNEHVLPTFNFVQGRIMAKANSPTSMGSDTFSKAPSCVQSLVNEEYLPWTTTFICKSIGKSSDWLVKAMKKDEGVALQILLGITGLPANLRFSSQCAIKEVLNDVLQACVDLLGNRHKNLEGIEGPDHTVSWEGGAFKPTHKDGKLTHMTHKLTSCTVDISNLGLDTRFSLADNWSEHSAALVKPPLKPIKISTFFDAKLKQGPHSHQVYRDMSKAKFFTAHIEKCYQAWMARKAAESTGPQVADSTVQQLKDFHGEKKKRISDSARKRAAEALASKASKRRIKISKSDPPEPTSRGPKKEEAEERED